MGNLVIGKFYPPHQGHHSLIDRAVADGRTFVVVLYSKRETIPAWQRVGWLSRRHPDAIVMSECDELPVNFTDRDLSRRHAEIIAECLGSRGYAVDKVYGSEPYVEHLAEYFDAEPVMVDPERHEVPISSSMIRADMRSHWRWLDPIVRGDLCKRVVCIGAESCGTTTLARDLAVHYDTVWVPEYGRLYSEGIWGHMWTYDDLMHIWLTQRKQENAIARHAEQGILICDTNRLATSVWAEFLTGRSIQIEGPRADLYLLTDLCPWVDDGLREGEHYREAMQARFIEVLNEQFIPWIQVTGSPAERQATAVEAIDALAWAFDDPIS